VAPLIEKARRSHNGAIFIALVFAALGETDQTMVWLEEAFKNHEPYLMYLNVWGDLDGVRADPRFQDLVRRIGIPRS